MALFKNPKNGLLSYIQASWTDIDPPDPMVELGRGQSCFRLSDLLVLRDYLDALKAGRKDETICKLNYVNM